MEATAHRPTFVPFTFSPAQLTAHLQALELATSPPQFLLALAAHQRTAHGDAEYAHALAAASAAGLQRALAPPFSSFFAAENGLLAHLVTLCTRLHALFPRGLPILASAPQRLALPRPHARCLLACMLLGVFPRAGAAFAPSSMLGLVTAAPDSPGPEKLRCMLQYFAHCAGADARGEAFPAGALVLERVAAPAHLAQGPAGHFARCAAPLLPLRVVPEASLEGAASAGCVKVDFAHCRIGGGVLGRGCVQEEILFCGAPELCVAMLLVPELGAAEALLLAGAAPFAAHRGYRDSFKFTGAVSEATWHTVSEADCAGSGSGSGGGGGGGGGDAPAAAAGAARAAPFGGLTPGSCRSLFIAIDAINFRVSQGLPHQLLEEPLHRELVKASAGFGVGQRAGWPGEAGRALAPIATGHWGCGAYKGHRGLKLLVQWLAASAAGRQLQYHFFGEAQVLEEAQRAMAAVFGGAVGSSSSSSSSGGGGGGSGSGGASSPAPPVVTVGHLYAALRAYRAEGGGGDDIVTRVAAAAVALATAAAAAAARARE